MPTEVVSLDVGGRAVPLRLQVTARARRISLRVSTADGQVVLVLPSAKDRREGLAFAESRHEWILSHLARLPERVPFADGTVLPLLGRPHRIAHRPHDRVGGVRIDGDELLVSGRTEHVGRRIADFLKQEARRVLTPRAHARAVEVARPVARVSVRDPKSRWGSCSAAGGISFSWRLVMAPEPVLDYVVAHEVAHLVEMNHGRRFWRLVERLCPDHLEQRGWLLRHGRDLHRYG